MVVMYERLRQETSGAGSSYENPTGTTKKKKP